MSHNRDVIVQPVCSGCLSARSRLAVIVPVEPLVLGCNHCNEQKVALADNCQRTNVSALTSIIPVAAQFTPLCLFFLPLLLRFLSLFSVFLLPCNYSLSAVVNLAPPLPYLSPAGQSKGLLSKKTGRTEGGGRERGS